jgi:zinc/manganese transport system substrate-binding protein
MKRINHLVLLTVLLVSGLVIGLYRHQTITYKHKLSIVAGENFWGSLAAQLAGDKANIVSIVSDPNADPHEYESSSVNARQFATADYVVLNGAGYDSWGDKLLSANPSTSRKVLKVADLIDKKEGDNPHFWYNPSYVNQTVSQIEADLAKIDPGNSHYYETNLAKLKSSIATSYQNKLADIKQKYSGTKVAATEDIFVYMADAAGLDLVSPPAFIQAVAEGNDPPAASIVQFQQQIQNKEAEVLVYNLQTATPLTENVKKLATEAGIPIVGITETIQPPQASFQSWMQGQTAQLENALAAR